LLWTEQVDPHRAMPRVLLLILLLAPACARRDVATGNWVGAPRPEAGAAGAESPAPDKSSPAGSDAAAQTSQAPEAGAGGADFQPHDAAAPPFAASDVGSRPADPVAPPFDAGADTGDARVCPETGSCD
jgi:hypothetical protein